MGGGNGDGRAREFFVTDRPPQGPDRPPHKLYHALLREVKETQLLGVPRHEGYRQE